MSCRRRSLGPVPEALLAGDLKSLPILTIYCVIPAYRARATVADVVAQALAYAAVVVVVDDACPQQSGDAVQAAFPGSERVRVIRRERNGGVGAAMKTGIGYAIEQGADVIVKIDADGQMDCSFIPMVAGLFAEDPSLVCIKGNRFFDSSVLTVMPKRRLFGNALLSLTAKFASGYWNVIDPTNGYLGFNAALLQLVPWRSFADSYFFELSVLCELGLQRLPVLELEMPTIYTSAPSSLSIPRVAFEFPPKLLRLTLRRIALQYFVFDINLASVYMVAGFLLAAFGAIFGGYEWFESNATGIARPLGTVMLAALPFLMGFQLLLAATMYDVQFSPKTSHELLARVRNRARSQLSEERARASVAEDDSAGAR
jgi:glycosyltransferase involved in cell wall biosynthesis